MDNRDKDSNPDLLDSMLQSYGRGTDLFSLSARYYLTLRQLETRYPMSRYMDCGASSSSRAGAVEASVEQEPRNGSQMEHPMSRRINFGASSSSGAGAVEASVEQKPRNDSQMEHPMSRRINFGASSSSGAGAVGTAVVSIKQEPDSDVEIVDDTEVIAPPADLPPVAVPFVKPDLSVGTACIAKDVDKDFTVWRKAILLIEYNHLEFQGDTLRNLSMVKYNNGNTSSKFLKSSEMAYLHPFPSRIPVGTPVVTKLPSTRKYYYPGMVVEGPEFTNEYRYLILLDNGTSCYARHNELGVIRGKHTPKSLQIDKCFTKDCLNFYPDRFLTKFRIGERVNVNRQRSSSTGPVWKCGVVRSLDCSMVELRFPEGESRWYSRGSYRLMKVINSPIGIGRLRFREYIQRLRHVRQEFYRCTR